MRIQQFVMAYRADHDAIRRLLPEEFTSLRPVLRINCEIRDPFGKGEHAYIEFNTPVEARGKRGWLNLYRWESPATLINIADVDKYTGDPVRGSDTAVKGMTTVFTTPYLRIEYTGVGLQGGCPAESDNDGCFYPEGDDYGFVPAEKPQGNKEYCDCEFEWIDPYGQAMRIPCEEILGAYKVEFDRN